MSTEPAPLAVDPLRPATSDLSIAGYRLAAASVIGRGHVHLQRPCDDAFSLRVGRDGNRAWWFAAVADGAGSRELSRYGAEASTAAAAQHAADALAAGRSLRESVGVAVAGARTALSDRANQNSWSVSDLSCTLLCLACAVEDDRISLVTFQVGDGLIARIDDRGAITALARADDEVPGATRFLDSLNLADGREGRFRYEDLVARPRGLIIATDGLADDLIPWSENGPILAGELDQVAAVPDDAGLRLSEILSYEKRGSFDDRTLVMAWRRGESP